MHFCKCKTKQCRWSRTLKIERYDLVKILFAGVFGVVYDGSFCAAIIPHLKQTGINPVTFGKTDNAHDYIGFVMKVLIALLFRCGIHLFVQR